MKSRLFMYDLSIKTLKEIHALNRGVFPFIAREVVKDRRAQTFFCRSYNRGFAKGSCGFACPAYKPKNGDGGACIHFGAIHKYGDVYEIRSAPNSLRAVFHSVSNWSSQYPRIIPGYRYIMRDGTVTGAVRRIKPKDRGAEQGRFEYLYTDGDYTWTPDGDYIAPYNGVRVVSRYDIVSRHETNLCKL